MARTLHLLVCISAAMTASGGYIPYSFQSWSPPYNFKDSGTMDYATQYDSINVKPDRSNAKIMMYEPVKIVNRGPKPVPLYWRRARSAEDTRKREIPKECVAPDLCDNVPDYPADVADKIIAELGDKIKYLAMDELHELPPKPNTEVEQREGGIDYSHYQELCASETMIKYPLGGFDTNNTYHKILNNEKNPIQGVRVEICNETEEPCTPQISAMPTYHAFCTQKYAYRPMLVIDGNKELVVHIAVPSWCACVVSPDKQT